MRDIEENKRQNVFMYLNFLLVAITVLSFILLHEYALIQYSLNLFVLSGLVVNTFYCYMYVKRNKLKYTLITSATTILFILFFIFVYFMGEGGYPPLIDLFNNEVNN